MVFDDSQLKAIADALGDTSEGLTGSEIGDLLKGAAIVDSEPLLTKRIRLYNAFARDQITRQDRRAIITFILEAMKPERFMRNPERFEPLRAKVNFALLFAGIAVTEAGQLIETCAAQTLAEAERRAQELRTDLSRRGVHPDVLKFCKQELLADNYFHAVLEAMKSVAEKVRNRTGLTDDGATLVDRAFGGDTPMLAINSLASRSEKDEQRGFVNLVKGAFSMFRNTTAHAARVHWTMSKEDAEDLFSLASLIHRRIDDAEMPPRV